MTPLGPSEIILILVAKVASRARASFLAPLPYVLVYSINEEIVHILRFLHTSQDRI